MTILNAYRNYLQSERRLSLHTVKAYLNDIDQFENFLIKTYSGIEWNQVTHHHIRSWIVEGSKNKISTKSLNRKISSLKSFYKYLRRSNLIEKDPTQKIQSLRKEKRLPSVISKEDTSKVLESFQGAVHYPELRDQLLLELLYQTGIRRAELISLKMHDINLSKGSIKVIGKGDKERIIPIGGHLVELMIKYIDIRNKTFDDIESIDFLLLTNKGETMYPKFVYNKVRKYLDQVTNAPKRSPHVLRHSFATHLSNEGAELNAIKELLGHSSLAATQIYTHNAIEKLKKAYRQAHPNS